jgi:hypothetical protein
MIFKIHKKDNFTLISNDLINDPSISAKSKAVLIYLLSKPLDWNANIKDISNHFTDGIDAIKSSLVELEKEFYLRRTRIRTDKGTFKTLYDVYEDKRENPKNLNYLKNAIHSGLPTVEIPLYNNTNNKNIKKIEPIDSRIKKFKEEVMENTQYLPSMLEDFVSYWTEKTRTGKRFLAETKPTFEIKRRLSTWYKNSKPNKMGMSDAAYDQKKKEELRIKKEEERRDEEMRKRREYMNRPVETATPDEIKEILSKNKLL